MLVEVKDYLVNMLFIILPILMSQALLSKQHISFETKSQKVILTIVFSVTSLLCLSFPVQINHGILDLRLIPFIIGTLYGGLRVGIVVGLTSILYRFFIGGVGFYFSVAEYILVFGMLLSIVKKYRSYSFIKKTLSASIISAIPTIIGIPIGYYVFHFHSKAFEMALVLIMISVISIVITVYLLETTIEKMFMLIELHKLEKVSIVSHLAASVSHEVRNPLTVTKGFIQLLRDKHKDSEDSEYFDLALNELKNAEMIISDFLTFAKPAINKVEKMDLVEEIQQSINVITPFANINNIKIEFNGSSAIINGDKQKLHQIFLNIFKNSVEAMPQGGQLTITLLSNRKKVNLMIKDTGIGMNSAQLIRLGEPYFSTKENGTGLGMMVAFSLLKSLGGTYRVYSEPQKGTTFFITFANEK